MERKICKAKVLGKNGICKFMKEYRCTHPKAKKLEEELAVEISCIDDEEWSKIYTVEDLIPLVEESVEKMKDLTEV